MDKHLKSHATRRSWNAVRKKKAIGHQVLGCMWVFTYKTDKHGMLQNCKARLVVCGNQQESGDLPTRATTLAATSFRTLMAIAAKLDLETIQLDAVNAFVNAELNELVYMRTPPGFPIKDHVLRLNKALYGLRRLPLLWQKELSKALSAHGFQAVPQKPCILIKGSVIAFYFVDDIVFCYRKFAESEAYAAVEALKKSFEITELGEIKWFLGLHVIRDRQKRLLWLSQKAYVEKICERFGLAGDSGHQPTTPIPVKELYPSAEPPTTSFRNLYQKKVGLVLYAAVQTRSDIAFAFSRFARFNYCCDDSHIILINEILRYLWLIRGYIIRYNGEFGDVSEPARVFICHTNALFADDVTDRKSSQGYIMMLFRGLISYRANRQDTVITLTTEAELLALSQAARKCIYMARLFEALTLKLNKPLEIRCDNRQTIRLLTEESAKLKTKLWHVDVHNHWLRQEITEQNINLLWEFLQRTLADGLTKPLPPAKFSEFVKLLQLDDLLNRLKLLERAEAIYTRVNEKLAAAKSGNQSESFKWNAIPNQSILFS
jgi:hypothetical protein